MENTSERSEIGVESGTRNHERSGETRGVVRSIARAILWPLRRFIDPRVANLAQSIDVTRDHLSQQAGETRAAVAEAMREVKELVEADLDAATETATVLGQGINDVRAMAEASEAALGRIVEGLAVHQLADDGDVDALDRTTARLLNYASSHRGFAAQRGLWFNWPVSVTHEPGNVTLGDVNERIAEMAYAFRALSGVEPGAKILDVGASESTVALSLASLGYEVTAIDPRPYPLSHPRLRVVVGGVEEWDPGERFAALLCISTLEHIGSGEYGQPVDGNADADALRRLQTLTEPGGLLILTTPYGHARDAKGARVYDRATLETLLAAWTVEDFTIIAREDATTWLAASRTGPDGEAVALITARRKE
jgi:2-polyprenyl-3-methyl-5-hydroxy-6-metoxy-1,4-benzoquinol methylase